MWAKSLHYHKTSNKRPASIYVRALPSSPLHLLLIYYYLFGVLLTLLFVLIIFIIIV